MPDDEDDSELSDAVEWYDGHADEAVGRYESLAPEEVNKWLRDFLPDKGGFILDVGAGSGRDAAWLSKDHDVIAVEPSKQMRKRGQQLHAADGIIWLDDRLPGLEKVHERGVSFDFVLLNAVWMHLPPRVRPRAFRKLVTLLRPGGRFAISFRQPDPDQSRSMFPCHDDEIESLARDRGLLVEKRDLVSSQGTPTRVEWTCLILRLPDDSTEALPIIRYIILRDSKYSTYKLALLRVLARIAEGSLGLARSVDDKYAAVPLGLVAVFWLRQFRQLLQEELPQMPKQVGLEGLGFVRDAYRNMSISPHDLRVAQRFEGDQARLVNRAIQDANKNIKSNPAKFTSYPDRKPLYLIRTGPGPGKIEDKLVLDADYLRSFGELLVPESIWRVLTRLNVWIEPALVAEWIRFMKGFLVAQGRELENEGVLYQVMQWTHPKRDVKVARDLALKLLAHGQLLCVWSGKPLTLDSLDIDHCFPWSAWPCGDLWNLLPAHRVINQKLKADQLPSNRCLTKARERICEWWDRAYKRDPDSLLCQQFFMGHLYHYQGLAKRPQRRLFSKRLRCSGSGSIMTSRCRNGIYNGLISPARPLG